MPNMVKSIPAKYQHCHCAYVSMLMLTALWPHRAASLAVTPNRPFTVSMLAVSTLAADGHGACVIPAGPSR